MLHITARAQVDLPVIDSELSKSALNVAMTVARDLTPVDTGAARAGWTVGEGMVYNDVSYVKFLDEGTIRLPALNITTSAVNAALDHIRNMDLTA